MDGRVVNLQVTDASEHSIQIHAMASARNSQDVWDLRCKIRQKLVAFLREDHPNAFPKQRTELRGLDGKPADLSGLGPDEKALTRSERRSLG